MLVVFLMSWALAREKTKLNQPGQMFLDPRDLLWQPSIIGVSIGRVRQYWSFWLPEHLITRRTNPTQSNIRKPTKISPSFFLEASMKKKKKIWKSLGGKKKEHGLLHLKDAMFRCKQGVVDILMDGIKYHLKEEQDQKKGNPDGPRPHTNASHLSFCRYPFSCVCDLSYQAWDPLWPLAWPGHLVFLHNKCSFFLPSAKRKEKPIKLETHNYMLYGLSLSTQ